MLNNNPHAALMQTDFWENLGRTVSFLRRECSAKVIASFDSDGSCTGIDYQSDQPLESILRKHVQWRGEGTRFYDLPADQALSRGLQAYGKYLHDAKKDFSKITINLRLESIQYS